MSQLVFDDDLANQLETLYRTGDVLPGRGDRLGGRGRRQPPDPRAGQAPHPRPGQRGAAPGGCDRAAGGGRSFDRPPAGAGLEPQ